MRALLPLLSLSLCLSLVSSPAFAGNGHQAHRDRARSHDEAGAKNNKGKAHNNGRSAQARAEAARAEAARAEAARAEAARRDREREPRPFVPEGGRERDAGATATPPESGEPDTGSRPRVALPEREPDVTPPPRREPEELTPVQVNTGLRAHRDDFRDCFQPTDDTRVNMRINIRPDGSVGYAAAVNRDEVDPTLTRCLVRVLSGVRFDTYDGDPMNVRHTFTRAGP